MFYMHCYIDNIIIIPATCLWLNLNIILFFFLCIRLFLIEITENCITVRKYGAFAMCKHTKSQICCIRLMYYVRNVQRTLTK